VDNSFVDLSKPYVVQPGSYSVEVMATGYENWKGPVAVKAGEDKVFEVPQMTKLPQRQVAANRPATTTAAQPAANPSTGATESQCNLPGPTYNVDGSCFDARPNPLASPLVPLTPEIPDSPAPGRVMLMIQVGIDGKAMVVRNAGAPSPNTAFMLAAINYAKSIEYKPAEKNGAKVVAWLTQPFLPKAQ
jgi:hypothetical protein